MFVPAIANRSAGIKRAITEVAVTEQSVFSLSRELFEALAKALSAESEEDLRTLFEVVHRDLVIFDDYLCERFGFSRKPRGKYVRFKKEKQDGVRNADGSNG